MSKFLKGIFGGNKSKKNKPENNQKTNTKIENDDQNIEENGEVLEGLPPSMTRRLSLSKSGRMKEKKRVKMSILENQESKQPADDIQEPLNTCESDIFDTQGIIEIANSSQNIHKLN
ncbi:unnamed protein product [Brassicogethes aeneus]|uniref:Uncharacterized protein n=1 Tax=Brassicogethes aeneus TaxID=1431903 RepID=A0A9P0B3I9_BRAAE|nr:unnamed protein product [Brassicogethes aeneus]